MNTQFVTVFKRLKPKKNNELPLKPVDIIFGEIKDTNGKKNFISSSGEKLKCGDDFESLNDTFVYGYPFNISEFIRLYSGDSNYSKLSYTKDNKFYSNGSLLVDDIKEPFIREAFLEYLDCINLYYFYQKYLPDSNYIETYYCRRIEENNLTYLDSIDSDFLRRELELDIDEDDDSVVSFSNIEIEKNDFNTKNVIEKVCNCVIGQDEAVKSVVSSINANHHIIDRSIKRNILLVGPTGCGKTEIFRSIAKEIKCPFVTEDSTQYTSAGFVGRSIEDMFTDLINVADGDIEKAQYGIIFVDEIDKKAAKKDGEGIATSAVLDSLLKPLDGDPVIFKYKHDLITFDTTHITFGFAGAFSGLEKEYIEKVVGFCSNHSSSKTTELDRFNDYGIKPEFMGRINIMEYLNSLSLENLIAILNKSVNNPIIKNTLLFDSYNTKLTVVDDAIFELATIAKNSGKGARGLNLIFNLAIKNALIDVQSDNSIKEVIIDKETIHDNKKYVLKR